MPRRSFSSASAYKFGFNGKENDNEVKGLGNQQDYGMRIYDARVGRFLSIDPLQKKYPYFTPFQFSGNQPIWAIDLDGLEPYYRTGIKHIPSQYDNSAMQGTIGDYTGLISGYAIEYEKKTYVIYESAHGTRQWYVEYDKDGWKGSPTEFQWYNPGNDKSFDYLMLGMLSSPFAAMGLIEGGFAISPILKEQALNLAIRGLSTYKKALPYLPLIGNLGRQAADILDESGSAAGVNKVVTFNKAAILSRYTEHIFTQKHIKDGIMSLGNTKDEILQSVGNVIEQNLGKLKEGYNTIVTKLNGNVATIKAFVKDGEVQSVNAFKGTSARETDNLIDLTKNE